MYAPQDANVLSAGPCACNVAGRAEVTTNLPAPYERPTGQIRDDRYSPVTVKSGNEVVRHPPHHQTQGKQTEIRGFRLFLDLM